MEFAINEDVIYLFNLFLLCSSNSCTSYLLFIKHHQYTAFTHTYSGTYRGFFDSSLSKGLNTTDHDMLFSSNTMAFVLTYLFTLYDLQDPSVPKSLWHGGADHC